MPSDEFVTTTEVAEWLRVPPSTVRFWRHQGTGPHSARVGRRVLYRRADVEAWVAQQFAAGR